MCHWRNQSFPLRNRCDGTVGELQLLTVVSPEVDQEVCHIQSEYPEINAELGYGDGGYKVCGGGGQD